MNEQARQQSDQPTFWREEGGARWVTNIETVEQQIAGMSEVLMARAGAQPGERVIDVGCGGGVTSAALAYQVGAEGHVVGIDVSPVILEVAKQRYASVEHLRFECANAETTQLDQGSYDLIFSRFGVMFFEDPFAAFANLHSALSENGRLVFMCWRTPQENPWMMATAASVFDVLGPPPPADPDAPGPFALGDPERVHRILRTAGFDNVSSEPLDHPVNLGSTENAIKLLSEMGPAAALLGDASDSDREAAITAVRSVLEHYRTADGILMPAAAWIVSATP